MSGQVIYHLLAAAHASRAPWPVVTFVACLPVISLGFGAALAHLLRADEAEARSAGSAREARMAARRAVPMPPGRTDTREEGPYGQPAASEGNPYRRAPEAAPHPAPPRRAPRRAPLGAGRAAATVVWRPAGRPPHQAPPRR